MNAIIFLIERTSIGLYILIAVAVVWYGRRWLAARYAFRATQFELERDLARYQIANALTAVVLLAELGLMISGVERVVAPTMREQVAEADLLVEAPVEDLPFYTPTPPPPQTPEFDTGGVDLGAPEVQAVFFTPTPTPTPVGTIEPNAPSAVGCDTPNAILQVPANGMRVFQPIAVMGTAYIDNFAYFKLEISGPTTNNRFAVIGQMAAPVELVGGLAQFNPAPYDPGLYQFQVMVFDITDTLKASCQVNIYISAPVPTPTDLPLPTPRSSG